MKISTKSTSPCLFTCVNVLPSHFLIFNFVNGFHFVFLLYFFVGFCLCMHCKNVSICMLNRLR